MKYSGSGEELWNVRYNGISNGDDVPVSVRLDGNNNVFVTGKSYSDSTDFDYVTIKYSQTVGINTISNQIPDKNYLEQNYPNPFNPSTVIRYSLKENSFTTLNVYNSLGKSIATLVNESQSPGSYQVDFSAADAGINLPSGVYFYKLSSSSQASNFTEVKKMILIR